MAWCRSATTPQRDAMWRCRRRGSGGKATSRRPGAFQRNTVGCEQRSLSLSGKRPKAGLKPGSLRRSSSSSLPQAMASMRAPGCRPRCVSRATDCAGWRQGFSSRLEAAYVADPDAIRSIVIAVNDLSVVGSRISRLFSGRNRASIFLRGKRIRSAIRLPLAPPRLRI